MKNINQLILLLTALFYSALGNAMDVTVDIDKFYSDNWNQETKEMLDVAALYYSFWDTGKEEYAKTALANDFTDLNLPESRAQGLRGVLAASKQFRLALPDLSVDVQQVYIVGNKVIGQLLITGHFTGTLGDKKGKGQKISFTAVDIYTIKDGKIISNWHLEDNLTLMKQLGALE
ncbi:ester cyclase [Thalassotalea eurytherma]|uniref:Ester cyclase n=1 Tax=Thalassotalea eurytherma TaxID=1144278 RepID=A0ABQ6H445_9GAMM|nr:ester cyclase [Thalassotalea eurytherma]GLX82284.1 hypothetical protein theurythT_17360 [Thalassotalea eurytherma]